MLKQFIAPCAALALFVAPALAQDASEISRVQAGKDCQSCNLFQADLSFRTLDGVKVSGSRLRQANLSLGTFNKADMSGANLSIANLYGARLTQANLSGTNLTNATLVGISAQGTNLSGANLNEANLSGAELATAIGLTQAQLDAACGDNTTQLPQGLTVPACR